MSAGMIDLKWIPPFGGLTSCEHPYPLQGAPSAAGPSQLACLLRMHCGLQTTVSWTAGDTSTQWIIDMQQWAHDLSTALGCPMSVDAVFKVVEAASRGLGFEWCAFGLRSPNSLTRPDFQLINNYPAQWRTRYQEAGYLASDPTIKRGIRSQLPMLWNDALFAEVPCLWNEAQAIGLHVGWAQSRFDGTGAGSLLTLARSGEALSHKELESKALQLNWLVSITHDAFTRVLNMSNAEPAKVPLTRREIEVLKWSAEGKTTEDIASILSISEDTVKFHIRNTMLKLDCTNRVSAVVRALSTGLLS